MKMMFRKRLIKSIHKTTLKSEIMNNCFIQKIRFYSINSIVCLLLLHTVSAQQLTVQEVPNGASLRGICALNHKIVWVSGSMGTVGRSIDGGINWEWIQVPGFEKTEFRDIEVFDKNTAIIMSIASPAYILRTKDGGKSWQPVYTDTAKDVFLDALLFWNPQSGIAIGDPIDGHFYILRTFSSGKTWKCMPPQSTPEAITGEALFAASGSNIGSLSNREAVFVTGGTVKRFFKRDTSYLLPFTDTSASSGPNSIWIRDKKRLMISGGDYLKPDDTTNNCLFSNNGGITWQKPLKAPGGYRSAVIHVKNDTWLMCGINGTDISNDNGNTWQRLSTTGFHAMDKGGKVVFLCGKGRIGILKF